jgi:hypothetical protein
VHDLVGGLGKTLLPSYYDASESRLDKGSLYRFVQREQGKTKVLRPVLKPVKLREAGKRIGSGFPPLTRTSSRFLRAFHHRRVFQNLPLSHQKTLAPNDVGDFKHEA